MRMQLILGFLASVFLAWSQQTTLIDPATDGGFEGSGTAGWTLVDQTGAANRWCIGNAATPSAGNRCAYVSDTAACNRHQYQGNSTTTIHLYRPITVPAGQTFLTLSFKAILRGEGEFDHLRVYLVPQGTAITGGIDLPNTAQLFKVIYDSDGFEAGCYIVSPTNWTTVTHYTCADAGQYMLVFTWKNDYAFGNNPPIAVDEISLIASATASDPVAALGAGVTNVTTFPYTHTPSPSTTCGQGDEVQSFNTENACNAAYLDGEDRLWAFTAPQSGCLEVIFWGDTTESSGAWRYFGLQLFEGNPVACGRCIGSHTTSNRAQRTLRANVTSGQKYYLLLDIDPVPGCGRFLELRMSLQTGPCASALPMAASGGLTWQVGPSPAHETISLQGTLTESGLLHVRVFTAVGQKLYETSLEVSGTLRTL